MIDVVVVGSGPNGLTAACLLAQAGLSVHVIEAKETIGGGARTAELTLPGFHHDICSAIHPMGVASPAFEELDLTREGVEWIFSKYELAHPFDDGSAALLSRDMDVTRASLGVDGDAWDELVTPFLKRYTTLLSETLRPIRFPRHPLLMLRFGMKALRSCESIVRSRFSGPHARALFAGCAAHSILPLNSAATSSFGLMLAIVGHAIGWPLAKGGSVSIVNALASKLASLGGTVQTAMEVRSMNDLPESRAVLFDLTPRQIARIAGDALPRATTRRFERFAYGPGSFKIDWALDGPIPWRASECHEAATVHIGSTYEEIARGELQMSRGAIPDVPFTLVAQQSLFDSTRAPDGRHTGWGYCHVPHGSNVDMTEKIEAQVERMAPGFRDLIIARHVINPVDLEAHNANMIGGDIGGGANTLMQFMMRPTVRWNPYTTPNKRLFLCSSSTPPGGGVHGMCGYWCARTVLANVFGIRR